MESENSQIPLWEREAREAFTTARPGYLPLYVHHLPIQDIPSLEAMFVLLDGEGKAAQDLVFRHDGKYSLVDCTRGMEMSEQQRQLAMKLRETEEQL